MERLDPKQEAENLRQEAKLLLNQVVGAQRGFESSNLNRAVDCIISAAILGTAIIQKEAQDGRIQNNIR